MNNTNPIFEALDELNENYAAEAVMPRKNKMKKPLKIVVIAAAAVILTLIAGSSMPRTKNYGKERFYYGISENDYIEFDITPQRFTFPEELVFEDWLCNGELETIADVYKTFGIKPLVNDNFTVGDRHGVRRIIYNAFDVDGVRRDINIDYYLYDKNLGDFIRLESKHCSGVNSAETHGGGQSYVNVEIITLKDASPCALIDDFAYFSNEGALYRVDLSYGEKTHDRDDVKQVLADLGVL